MTRPLAVVPLLMLAVLVSGAARAADGAPADPAVRAAAVTKLNEDGMILYRARDYRHAVEKFLQAEALDQDPNLLFNIARCYEMLGDRDAAIEKYETFLTKPDADAQGKRRANEAIRLLRQAQPAPVESATPALAPSPSGAATPVERERTADLRASSAAPRQEGGVLNARTVTLGAGVLVAASGAVAYALGASDHGKVTSSAGYGKPGQVDPLTESEARRLIDSGNTKKLVGEITMGVGAALMVTSAILFVVHASHEATGPESGALAFGIVPSKSGGQLLLEGRF